MTTTDLDKKVIHDREEDKDYSLRELRAEYYSLRMNGDTEAETFEDYLERITSKNGTCEWIGDHKNG